MTPRPNWKTRGNDAWRTRWVILGGGILCALLMLTGLYGPELFSVPGLTGLLRSPVAPVETVGHKPFLELTKLVFAAVLGMIVTSVHRRTSPEGQHSNSLEHAQILLCISGAIIMIIIGDSLARAFGVAGGASIVRFRTPVEDPKEALILFLLLALGMACGLGAFGVAALATLFLCIVLVVLDRMSVHKPREMMLEVVSEHKEFPADVVQSIFSERVLSFEAREVVRGDQALVRYLIVLDPASSLEELSAALMEHPDAAIKSVSWVRPRKST